MVKVNWGGLIGILCGLFAIANRKWIAYINARENLAFKPNYDEKYL